MYQYAFTKKQVVNIHPKPSIIEVPPEIPPLSQMVNSGKIAVTRQSVNVHSLGRKGPDENSSSQSIQSVFESGKLDHESEDKEVKVASEELPPSTEPITTKEKE